MSHLEINAWIYIIFSVVVTFMLLLDTVTFIYNRKIEYGIGAILWTVMIFVFR